MTVQELIAQAKECCEQPRMPRLSAETELDTIDSDNIDSLMIAPDYTGSIPNLCIFPKLKTLHILKQISLTDFEKMDFSSIEELYVNFEKKEPFIRFNLPKIKKLQICISNNEDYQLSLFDLADTVIDISGCVALEELELHHCTGCEIKTDMLPKLKKYKTIPCETFTTEKERDFQMFLFSVRRSRNLAYLGLKSARTPNPKRNPFVQKMYDRETDEQIFVRNLASNIKHTIEYHTSTKKSGRKNILLTAEELTEYVLQEYPFLVEFFRKEA